MRTLSLLFALLSLLALSAQAGVTAFPAVYQGYGSNAYENLRGAKIAWLSANAASLASDLSGAQAKDVKARDSILIARLGRRRDEIMTELALMRGPRTARQAAVLKHNVESWIAAARHNGNGAVALRLSYDLQNSGL